MGMGRRHFVASVGAIATTTAVARRSPALAQNTPKSTARVGGSAYRSATELRAMLDARQVSARELLEQAIARIEAYDPEINAVVVRDFERARAAASAADSSLARGERRPLLGLPMTVKESFNVAGLPTTWGMPAFKDWRPSQDALAVARLKAAGAVIVGKTNIPLAISDWQSFNDVYGTTNNPWDRARTPGGSSGGAAAALAAGYVALELGSDINGSIRQPAHCCGVFGHKPSTGLVPLHGHAPPRAPSIAADGTVGLGVVGPLARSADDLDLALGLLAGPDDADALGYRLALPPPRHERLAEFRILLIDTHPLLPTASPIGDALDRLGKKLEGAGATVARTSPLLPDLTEAARLHQKLVFAFSQAFVPPEVYRRVEAAVAQLSPDDQSLAAWRLRATIMSHRDWIAANGQRGPLRQQWRALFREWDVVLCPAAVTPAFPHDHQPDQNRREIEIDGKRYPYRDQSVWPGIATTPGLPATVAPIELSKTGLPVGVQIVGPYLEDRTTIAFAKLLEREFGGFVPPPGMGG
jgi:amidase